MSLEKSIEVVCTPEEAADETIIALKIQKKAGRLKLRFDTYKIIKKSLDARKSPPLFRLRVMLISREQESHVAPEKRIFKEVHNAPEVHIIGAGPAGYFCALELLELGLKPVIFERGKNVQTRRRDLRAIQQDGLVNVDSNYCFGEGGAGTYSDGKLYTRAKKRGQINKVIDLLCDHGASDAIKIDAHPHIGSNKLPGIVANIRDTLLKYGGEVRFDHRVTDFSIQNGKINQITVNDQKISVDRLVLATGHSARGIFELFSEKELSVEFKPFALGVRVEHSQKVIDKIQYKLENRGPYLPAASYSLACQIKDRGVYSFCMCPGGLIVPASTSPGEIVVNGMSLSRRDSAFANSGLVTEINWEDIEDFHQYGPLAGMHFQKSVEQRIFSAGDGSQCAPAQRLRDFVNGKLSSTLPATSYIPGVFSARVDELLPPFITEVLKKGILTFGRRMKGYLNNEAVVIPTESRTSSPVRIPRNAESLMHPDAGGLFPCGEGAGYAGGILSAAMDGQRVARAVFQSMF